MEVSVVDVDLIKKLLATFREHFYRSPRIWLWTNLIFLPSTVAVLGFTALRNRVKFLYISREILVVFEILRNI